LVPENPPKPAVITEQAVEMLSAELHAIYQREARRQAGTGDDTVRHPDDYNALPEHTKEYDRVLARFILQRDGVWVGMSDVLSQEIKRLSAEVDRLERIKGGTEHTGPLSSHADPGHPLYPLWQELGLNDPERLVECWEIVNVQHCCPKCGRSLAFGNTPIGGVCEGCSLLWYAPPGHFALDTIERARARGPDS
jgi:hypothetical protein